MGVMYSENFLTCHWIQGGVIDVRNIIAGEPTRRNHDEDFVACSWTHRGFIGNRWTAAEEPVEIHLMLPSSQWQRDKE
jgi:hypothetical protein